MSQINTTAISGDVAIGRHLTAGGSVNIRGDVTVKRNLKVEGWIDAKNIKGPSKGLYSSIERLRSIHPVPHDGWWALVGETLPAKLWVADGGEWIATGKDCGSITTEVEAYETQLTEFSATLTDVKNQSDDNLNALNELNTAHSGTANKVAMLETQVRSADEEFRNYADGLEQRLTTFEATLSGEEEGVVNKVLDLRLELNAVKQNYSTKQEVTNLEEILVGSINDIGDRVNALSDSKASAESVNTLSGVVSALSSTVANKADSNSVATVDGRVTALETDVNGKLSTLTTNVNTEVSSLGGRITSEVSSLSGRITSEVSSLTESIETTNGEVSSLTDRVEAIESKQPFEIVNTEEEWEMRKAAGTLDESKLYIIPEEE